MTPSDLPDLLILPRPDGLTPQEMANWRAVYDARVVALRAAHTRRGEIENKEEYKKKDKELPSQAYAVIHGRDSAGVTKILVARKAVINAFTTDSGQHVPQALVTEVRGAGQYALPGGKALKKVSLASSAADEALAEAAVNVRNGSFHVTGVVRSGNDGLLRSHTFFQYHGDIEELAARSNAVLHTYRTADNEIESVHAMPLQDAMARMTASHEHATEQASKMDEEVKTRFAGGGQGWHTMALQTPAAQRAMSEAPRHAATEPTAASATPAPRPRSNSVLAMPAPGPHFRLDAEPPRAAAAASSSTPATFTTSTTSLAPSEPSTGPTERK